MRRKNGFSLHECAIMVVVLGLLVSVLLPMLGATRRQMRGMDSTAKMMLIGQGGAMYAQDNADRVFGYSWRAGETYTLFDGRTRMPISDHDAGAYQNQEILQRLTGRISGEFKIRDFTARIAHRRFGHLVLLDYLGQAPDTDAYIDPSDVNQIVWTSNPLEYGPSSGVPYAEGDPGPGYDQDSNWSSTAMRQRWAFASSYQTVPDAWQQYSLGARYIPNADTPHLFFSQGNPDLSTGHRFSQVLHPSNKVWMFEEFDRDRVQALYFGYDEAACEKLMFDGSVNSWESGRAAPSVVPEIGFFHWRQPYVPLDQFPLPPDSQDGDTPPSQRYRWTFGGLTGINYGPFSFGATASPRD